MKPFALWCLGMVVLVAPSIQTRADVLPADLFVNATVENSVASLKLALESNSPGMKASAAQTVRSLKSFLPERSFSSLVIPLMRLVKDEDADIPSRILSALALHELHSAIGDFAISRTAQFTDDPRMKHLCTWLTYHQEQEDIGEVDEVVLEMQRLIEQEKPVPLPEDISMSDR